MILPDKTLSLDEALAGIGDGATIMLGGFGVPGTPFTLIRQLVRLGAKNLTIIKNDANEKGLGVDHLLANGQVRRLITSHIGLNPRAIELMNSGALEVEFCPQGILAERVRAGGAGLKAILTDIGVDTELAKGKTRIELNGDPVLLEPALRADFALIHANRADVFGNVDFSATARNFNPLMAMAADLVIVEAETVVPLGGLQPESVHLSGAFVDHVVQLDGLSEEYDVVRR